MILRSYQRIAVDAAERALLDHGSTLIESATGTGKTTEIAELVARHFAAAGKRVLVMAHRRELLDQLEARIADRLGPDLRVTRSTRMWPVSRVVVASVQTMTRRLDDIPRDAFDLVVVDECFPAGTLVDGRPIETLQEGDLVKSYNHSTGRIEMKPVVHVFRSRPAALVTVHLDDGRRITCTAGHPFFTGKQYTPAAGLQERDNLYGHPASLDMHRMQEGLHHHHEVPEGPRQATRSSLLFDGVQGHVGQPVQFSANGADESQVCEREDAHQQPDASWGQQDAHAGYVASDGASPSSSRRERHRPIGDGGEAASGPPSGMGVELHRADWNPTWQWIPDPLQDRLGAPRSPVSDRGGRVESCGAEQTRPRREEAGVSRVARVVRVEIHERRGEDGFGDLCPGDIVYNIEVADNHNYFVDGILVHNCHHAPAPGYRAVLGHFAAARVLGVTATPDRADGVALGSVFASCAARYGIAEAVKDGYLAPARGVRVEVPGMDLSKVRQKVIRDGVAVKTPENGHDSRFANGEGVVADLHPGDLGRAAIAPAAVEGVVGPLLELAGDRRTVVFAVNRRHAHAIASSLQARGATATVVDGAMRAQERADAVAQHRAGGVQFLVNVMILTEGYDDPGIACIAMARPTTSRVLYAQACGRGLRLAEGKAECLVLDFVGVSCKFDLVGPEDVLGGALTGPVSTYRPHRSAAPSPVPAYAPPRSWPARFATRAVALIRRGAKAGIRVAKAGAKRAWRGLLDALFG